MRLIDADALMERVASISNPDMLTIGKVIGTIDTQPTAYDIDEIFNLNCKDISQDECDAYRGNCFHCQFDRVKQRAERLKEQDNEAD